MWQKVICLQNGYSMIFGLLKLLMSARVRKGYENSF